MTSKDRPASGAGQIKDTVMRVCIMGTPVNCGNRGVLALGASLVDLCSQAAPGVEVALLLPNRDSHSSWFLVGGEPRLIPVVHARMSPNSPLRHHFAWILLMSVLYRLVPLARVRAGILRSTPWIKAVAEADCVGDVRGGDSFSDLYGFLGLLSGCLLAWSVLLVRGNMVQFPQTFGPYRSRPARWLARSILKRSSVIVARDQASQKLAQELAGPGCDVRLSPDVAFSLEPVQPERLGLDPPLRGPIPPGVVGLNVNGLVYHGGYTGKNRFGLKLDYAAFLPQLVTALLAEHTGELWLVPHTYAERGNVESDNEACERLREALPVELRPRVRLVTAECNQHEVKWIIGQCDFFVGSRMHSCIAALSQGVPCAGVAYSGKFSGVFESVGMEQWVVDARSSTELEAVARVVALYRQRHEVREPLSRRARQARRQLSDLFQDLFGGGARKPAPPPSRRRDPEEMPVR